MFIVPMVTKFAALWRQRMQKMKAAAGSGGCSVAMLTVVYISCFYC